MNGHKRPTYEPSQREIRKKCKMIREEWPLHTFITRSVVSTPPKWMVPIISTDLMMLAESELYEEE